MLMFYRLLRRAREVYMMPCVWSGTWWKTTGLCMGEELQKSRVRWPLLRLPKRSVGSKSHCSQALCSFLTLYCSIILCLMQHINTKGENKKNSDIVVQCYSLSDTIYEWILKWKINNFWHCSPILLFSVWCNIWILRGEINNFWHCSAILLFSVWCNL